MEYKENFLFKSNVIREGYIFYFFVFTINAKSKEGDTKNYNKIHTELNFTRILVHENYNHGSSIVHRQFLASSPFLDS